MSGGLIDENQRGLAITPTSVIAQPAGQRWHTTRGDSRCDGDKTKTHPSHVCCPLVTMPIVPNPLIDIPSRERLPLPPEE